MWLVLHSCLELLVLLIKGGVLGLDLFEILSVTLVFELAESFCIGHIL